MLWPLLDAEGWMDRDDLLTLFTIVFLTLLCAAGVYLHRAPSVVTGEVPKTDFSVDRAMKDLRQVASQPRPIGSAANLAVRDYLVRRLTMMGLDPEVQETTVAQGWRVADVRNVMARLPGTASTGAILLAAHYDTVPMSPGAGDAGSAVVTLLETLRAIQEQGPLRNDVIFLFTNPEEVFLHGARAFLEHPWAKDVRLVINMDPGGTSGPAYLHGTSDQNGWLVREYADVVPHPMASSMARGVKRLIGDRNDEFKVFTEAGIPGYNISFFGSDTRYHTPLDSPDRLDPRSLQHLGSTAHSLVRHFGNRVLEDRREPDLVYFNPIGSFFVTYPEIYVLPGIVGVAVLFLVAWILGMLTRRLTLAGIGLGVLATLAAVVLAPLATLGVWWVLRTQLGVYDVFLTGNVYRGNFYLLGFVLLAVAVATGIYALLLRWTSMENMAFGAAFWWVGLAVASALYLPGGSYLFLWPVFFSLLALAYVFPRADDPGERGMRILVLLAGSVPAVLLVSPHMVPVFTALSMEEAPFLMALPALLVGLLVPPLSFVMETRRWLVPGLSLVAAGVALAMAVSGLGFDVEHPRPDFVVYGLDADEESAVWATRSRAVEIDRPDPWTRQFFPGETRKETLAFFPWSSSVFLQGDAPLAEVTPPTASLVEEKTGPDGRTLLLRIRSPRNAPIMIAVADRILPSWSVGKVAVDAQQVLAYWNVPVGGFELTVTVPDTEPLTLTLIDESYELPEIEGLTIQPRPDNMMREASGGIIFTDATVVRKSYTF
jgi:hypothetical protein